ncbi:MAG: hypothetical protein ACRCWR_01640 [Saezia sp.]
MGMFKDVNRYYLAIALFAVFFIGLSIGHLIGTDRAAQAISAERDRADAAIIKERTACFNDKEAIANTNRDYILRIARKLENVSTKVEQCLADKK